MVAFDFLTIVYFIAIASIDPSPSIIALNTVLGVLIALDTAARVWVAPDRLAMMRRVYIVADIFVILSLFLDPILTIDLSFLRILRGLRLVDSLYLLQDLRRASGFFRQREDMIVALVNMFVFVFFTTSFVFSFFSGDGIGPNSYIDALYFTAATLTTTGYGDIAPVTPAGKLAAVGIMIVGVSLFVNLARTIVLPSKVSCKCKSCGLSRHESDAVHCKHCGALVQIAARGQP